LRDARNSQNKIAFNICKNPETKTGFRIIWIAARDGNLDLVRVLAREGKPKNAPTFHLGMTPLHLAAKKGHILIVNFLLNEGVPQDPKNRANQTPYDLVKP